MPNIEMQLEFPDASPTDCYNAAERSIESLGYNFVKKRPLGWLLQIKNATINANISFRPSIKTMGTFSLTSSSDSEESLIEIAAEIASAIRTNL